jgi:saccharopine dehydrogenase-like NADP-dependent oxidoreductase
MFLPLHEAGADLEHRVANFLNINPTGKIMENLKWLGLFEDEPIHSKGDTAAEILEDLLIQKLSLPKDARDMVAIVHELETEYPENHKKPERIVSTFIEYGEKGGFTAISKTVGLPSAIAAKLLLTDQIPISGCHIPTHPAIYPRVLKELSDLGFIFDEQVTLLT